MDKYIIGIDGGGTKTLAVLYDIRGVELNRVIEGFSNFSIDEGIASTHIIQAIEQLVKNIPTNPHELYIQLGIAGATKMKDKGLQEVIAKRFNAIVKLDTDAMIGLYSVRHRIDQSVIMAIGGTGSAVITLENHQIHTIGGFGHLLGDEGSAYHLIKSMMRNLIRESEYGKPFSDLSKVILKAIGGSNEQDLIQFVYNKSKTDIAGLSQIVGQLAREGDTLTQSFYVKEGELLGEQIWLAHQRFIRNPNVVVAPRGSFVLEAPFVKESMVKFLKERIPSLEFEEKPQEPVKGAYHLAMLNLIKG